MGKTSLIQRYVDNVQIHYLCTALDGHIEPALLIQGGAVLITHGVWNTCVSHPNKLLHTFCSTNEVTLWYICTFGDVFMYVYMVSVSTADIVVTKHGGPNHYCHTWSHWLCHT